ncbi:MAG TPA: hypothetical protein VHA37_03210 [Candidatus Saccharimonadales bacterium]|nr:hypothetical protein [Candidatus Saccharimonadales bacterium]
MPTLLSAGMVLEAIAIAASREGKATNWRHLSERVAGEKILHHFEITFRDAENLAIDPLDPYIRLRFTNRRYYHTTPLTDAQKRSLAEALGGALAVQWVEGRHRRRVARLNMEAFDIRMRSECAYRALATCLDWNCPFPPDKLPVLGLPITAISRCVMRWAMASWPRIKILGLIPCALLPSAVETEWLPSLRCGAHFVLTRPSALPLSAAERTSALLAEGRALIRFWLTATMLGLALQPSYSPLAFAHYGLCPAELPSGEKQLAARCHKLAARFKSALAHGPDRVAFLGRIGVPRSTVLASRSLRLPLDALLSKSLPDS